MPTSTSQSIQSPLFVSLYTADLEKSGKGDRKESPLPNHGVSVVPG
jgi:hypothetical protein